MSSSNGNDKGTPPKELAQQLSAKYKEKYPAGTPVVVACELGLLNHLKVFVAGTDVSVKELLEKVGEDSGGYYRNTLMAAAEKERHEVLVQLLEYDVNTAITTVMGWNALHISAFDNKKSTRWCMVSLLNKMSLESINQKNKWGWTPLDCAYFNKGPIKNDIVQLIRQYGGKANEHDRNGKRVEKGKGDLNEITGERMLIKF